MNIFQQRVRSFLKEAIKLGFIGKYTHVETTHFGKDRVSVQKLDKLGNSFDLLEMFYDESFKHRPARIACTTNAIVFIREI